MEYIVRHETTLLTLNMATTVQKYLDESEKFMALEKIFNKRKYTGFIA